MGVRLDPGAQGGPIRLPVSWQRICISLSVALPYPLGPTPALAGEPASLPECAGLCHRIEGRRGLRGPPDSVRVPESFRFRDHGVLILARKALLTRQGGLSGSTDLSIVAPAINNARSLPRSGRKPDVRDNPGEPHLADHAHPDR